MPIPTAWMPRTTIPAPQIWRRWGLTPWRTPFLPRRCPPKPSRLGGEPCATTISSCGCCLGRRVSKPASPRLPAESLFPAPSGKEGVSWRPPWMRRTTGGIIRRCWKRGLRIFALCRSSAPGSSWECARSSAGQERSAWWRERISPLRWRKESSHRLLSAARTLPMPRWPRVRRQGQLMFCSPEKS